MGASASKPPAGSFVQLWFDGRPWAAKRDELEASLDDSFKVAFVGPLAGGATGKTMDKDAVMKMLDALCASHPDMVFNPSKAKPKKQPDGSWKQLITVNGTYTGEPFSLLPGKLPDAPNKGAKWQNGPEEFRVWMNAEGKGTKLEIRCVHKGRAMGPPGIYTQCGGKIPPADVVVENTIRPFAQGLADGSSATYAVGACTMQPPGSEPMPLEKMMSVLAAVKAAWPKWESRFLGAEKTETGTYKVKTQQALGPMVSDFTPGNGFPDLPLKTVPKEWKTTGFTLPVEVGTYKLEGNKVVSASYDGTIDLAYGGGTQETSAEFAAIWNQKGDGSDVGFAALYALGGAAADGSFAQLWFDGREFGSKKKEMVESMADEFRIAFVGEHAGNTTGATFNKEEALGAMENLVGSMPNFIFNSTKVAPVRDLADGGYYANIAVTGTYSGEPYTPMPGMLPPAPKKGVSWTIGPEEFKVFMNAEGKGTKVEIRCLKAGNKVGPPGIYELCGGVIPKQPAQVHTIRQLCAGFASLEVDKFTAPIATLAPPGMEPMPFAQMMQLMAAVKAAFPKWDSRFLGAEVQEDGTYKVRTQQALGRMMGDFKPPMADMPPILLKDAPKSWKAGMGVVLPVEVGTYTVDAAGKVASVAYDGTVDAKYGGGTQETSADFGAIWNKKGDGSDVGFAALYKIAGF